MIMNIIPKSIRDEVLKYITELEKSTNMYTKRGTEEFAENHYLLSGYPGCTLR